MKPTAGGLTADNVAKRAVVADPALRASVARLQAAEARVDQAIVAFFPTLTLRATYTRQSDVDNLTTIGACPDNPRVSCVLRPDELIGPPSVPYTTRTPVFLNRFSIVAGLSVPLSDYLLRIPQQKSAADEDVLVREAERATISADSEAAARLMFYAYAAAVAQQAVAKLTVDDAKTRAGESKALFAVDQASKADTLRLEAQVSRAEALLAEADAMMETAEIELRSAIDAKPGERVTLGESIFDRNAKPPSQTLVELQQRALAQRSTLDASDRRGRVLEQSRSLAVADYAPRVDAFANFYLQNPNPRQIPRRAEFFPTWDVGVSLTWTVNDTFSAIGRVAEVDAEIDENKATRAELERAIRLEVGRAYAAIKRAAAEVQAAESELRAAGEALVAQRELFASGSGNALQMIDAQGEVTRARLARVSAYVALAAAEVQLAHALGE